MQNPGMSLYKGKTILAPMVRIGNIAFRTYCADHGADVVFSEEVVAAKLSRCTREVHQYDETSGHVVEFVVYEPYKNSFKRSVVFSTSARMNEHVNGEGAPIVLQLGVAQATEGARAALLCCEDVDGIDINMGCPKKFSVDNGMGAALMCDTTRAASILVAIDDAVNSTEKVAMRHRRIPISFKTRLLETVEDTVEMLISIMERVGMHRVHAITLHARTVNQPPDSPPHYDRAADAVKRLRSNQLFSDVCFVLNGSVCSRADGLTKTAELGFDAAMIARHAMFDMSVFCVDQVTTQTCSSDGVPFVVQTDKPLNSVSWLHLYRGLLQRYARYRIPYAYVKYHLTRSVPRINAMRSLMASVQAANSYEVLAAVLGMSLEEQRSMRDVPSTSLVSNPPLASRDSCRKCVPNENVNKGVFQHGEVVPGQVCKKIRVEETL
ncbi:putative dihydrouridine synthase domain protein [Trypanosoma vivax]|nr:putative dihydrouridine synthase domain protein [Trypanosoma vivax]